MLDSDADDLIPFLDRLLGRAIIGVAAAAIFILGCVVGSYV